MPNVTTNGLIEVTGSAAATTRTIGVAAGTHIPTASDVDSKIAAINHDALTGFVAAEHIDWTSANANLSTSGTAATGALGVTGNITVSGTVDGRDVSADGVKLDGVETGATADQTDAEIETAYNTQVPQVSGPEITAGTETATRRFSPADVKNVVVTHGFGVSLAKAAPSWGGVVTFEIDPVATDFEVQEPIGVRPGDIVVFYAGSGQSDVSTITGPGSPWTQELSDASGVVAHHTLFWAPYNEIGPGPWGGFDVNVISRSFACSSFYIRDVNPDDPVIASATADSADANETNAVCPTITTDDDYALVIAAATFDGATGGITLDASTEEVDLYAGNPGQSVNIGLGAYVQVTAGATGTKTHVNAEAEQWCALQIAFRPTYAYLYSGGALVIGTEAGTACEGNDDRLPDPADEQPFLAMITKSGDNYTITLPGSGKITINGDLHVTGDITTGA